MSLYVKRAGKIFGPFTREEVSNCVSQDLFSSDHQISEDRMEWIRVSEYQQRLKASEASSSAAAPAPAPNLKVPALKPVSALKPVGQANPSPLKPAQAAAPRPAVAGQPVPRPVAVAGQPIPRPAAMAGQPIPRPMMPSGTGSGSPSFAITALAASAVWLISAIACYVINDPRSPAQAVFGWIGIIANVIAVVFSASGIKKSGPGGWRIASIVDLILSSLFLILTVVIFILILYKLL